ncbi:calmodulin-binding protein sha1 [Stemphylium lycopersici]|uniref:Calmodulin-binding protein sha1 n=1 Tax=Stemphylium lycopersici TaxID=183478 RepID=A0A364NAQ6_STELY|nr:calmodulin-binding protein sha1 [Stemphylium lycopersici]RAR14277.1 calmodulin-binding protein sha1 [Stemphylium lycopersici]
MAAPRLLVRPTRSVLPRIQLAARIPTSFKATPRFLSTTHPFSMPDQLKASEVNSKTDPSVAKQYDDETPKDQQIKHFFELVDGKKICMLNTYRNGVGPVGRSMALARRDGPDFLFLANAHSQKFNDLKENKEVMISFQDLKTQEWASISGTATTTDNSDPRIKEVWSRGAAAWFGDLGDGKHTGGPEDPRMTLIEIKAKYISYYLTEVGLLGYAKEIIQANITGEVANTVHGAFHGTRDVKVEEAVLVFPGVDVAPATILTMRTHNQRHNRLGVNASRTELIRGSPRRTSYSHLCAGAPYMHTNSNISAADMYRYTAGTPCPAPYSSTNSHYAPSYLDDNTTANLDYTTELKAPTRHVKPRRPMRNTHKPAFNPSLDIFEDVAQEEEQQQQQQRADFDVKRRSRASVVPAATRTKKSTILAHPAQKMPKPAVPVLEPQHERPHRRRVSQVPSETHATEVNATVQLREDILEKKELKKQGPKKDARRRTIYIPTDDTSVFTIHPGQPTHAPRHVRETSPDLGLDLVTLSEEEGNNLMPALKKEKKLPRKSLAAPPKRGPLSTTSRSTQNTSFSSDIVGSGGGKENVPPGMEIFKSKGNGTHIEIHFTKPEAKKPLVKAPKVHFSAPKEPERILQTKKRTEGTQKRPRSNVSHDDVPAKAVKSRADATASAEKSRASLRTTIKTERAKLAKAKRAPLSSSPFHTDKSPPTALRRQKTGSVASSITMLHEVGERPQAQDKYPVLKEDLAQPELYEDNWLTYQEVAITQLLNSVFDSASKDPNAEQSPEDLRKKMLAIYHDPAMPALHKRLQASLQFGALSIPKDLLAQTLRLKDDVGLRKKFLNLWTKSYDLNALRAAAETIVGRQITTPCRLSTGSTCSDDGSRQYRSERRAIESFLSAFLIKNEDAVRVKSGGGSIASLTRGDDDFGSQGWSWRRTALRSLVLILVLDQAKTKDAFSGCLFQTTSPYKTSVEILHQMSKMLLPSHGDITRPLNHLSYKVEHAQYPLQEYAYQIENIAIDLRDGIVLNRLVELLLYPATTVATQQEETVTLNLPTGELLTSDASQKDVWILSQHLKYPAIGRPQKVYNVQIALAALSSVPGMPSAAVSGIRAEDIVDGHREKTLSLLWSLVGKCGLGSLVDWPQLVKETDRFRSQWYRARDAFEGQALDSDNEQEETTELDGMAYHKRLLLSWSRSIARLHGLRVANLTTSFADPKVLEVIVDTYLPSNLAISTMDNGRLGLAAKLKAVGCSTSFIALFMPQQTTARSIPSRDFTLLTLSFLASRLLPLARTHRAASTIQSAFRRFLLRRQVSTRIKAMHIAHDCAVVAQARQRMVDAATVIQRRWKGIQEGRCKQLESDVLAFQALARGWAIRRWVRRITAGRVGGKEKVRRVRGGW